MSSLKGVQSTCNLTSHFSWSADDICRRSRCNSRSPFIELALQPASFGLTMLARRGAAAVPLVQASRSLLQQLRFKGQQPQVPQVHRSLAGTADLLTINVRHLLSSLKLRILDLVYPETWSARDFREGTVTAFKSVNSLLDEGDFLLLRQLLDEKLLEDLRSSHAHLTEGLKYELVEVYYLGIFHAMAKEDDQGFEAVFVTPLLRVTEKYTSLKDESVWWEVRRLHKWTFKRILLGEDAADWQIVAMDKKRWRPPSKDDE